jgi:hypothetical protein
MSTATNPTGWEKSWIAEERRELGGSFKKGEGAYEVR